MNLQDLKTELTTDPLARGYALMSDEQAANSLNTRDRQPDRESIDGGSIVAGIVLAEYAVLTASQKDYLRLVCAASSIPIVQNFRREISDIFAQGTESRGNLRALLKRTGSRAEELGLGTVTPSHVAKAKAL